MRIWKVGGAVRDELLGVKPKDIDYAVEAESWEEMKNYISQHGRIYLETPQYFTIRAHIDNLGDADFVLCRKDGQYKDGRHPESVEVGTIMDDLARRDFTINAMAKDAMTGELLDPFNGQEDLQKRSISTVGNPFDRFNEDALRMLRAIRFAVTKDFRLGPQLFMGLTDDGLLNKLRYDISIDRKRDELTKMFKYDTLRTLEYLEMFKKIRNILFEDRLLWLKPTNEE